MGVGQAEMLAQRLSEERKTRQCAVIRYFARISEQLKERS